MTDSTSDVINNLYEILKTKILNDYDFIGLLSDNLLKVCRVWGPTSRVHIGNETNMCNTLFNTISGDIYIGDYTFTGHNVSVITGTHNPSLIGKPRMEFNTIGNDIHIGNGVWLGSNCIILGPCVIEDNAVIAAGSVVLPGTHIHANELWAGIPAVYKKSV